MPDEYNAFFEGCFHDSPSLLQITGAHLSIPERVTRIAFEGDQCRYDLYGETRDFRTFSPYELPCGGLHHIDPALRWGFEANRSIALADGRLFVEELYIRDDRWQWYLARGLPDIIDAMRHVFLEKKDGEEINQKRIRLF